MQAIRSGVGWARREHSLVQTLAHQVVSVMTEAELENLVAHGSEAVPAWFDVDWLTARRPARPAPSRPQEAQWRLASRGFDVCMRELRIKRDDRKFAWEAWARLAAKTREE